MNAQNEEDVRKLRRLQSAIQEGFDVLDRGEFRIVTEESLNEFLNSALNRTRTIPAATDLEQDVSVMREALRELKDGKGQDVEVAFGSIRSELQAMKVALEKTNKPLSPEERIED